MYHIYGISGSSLLIESTDSIIKLRGREVGNMTPKPHQSLVRYMLCDHALLIVQVSGVAARAGSVHLISSMDRKPSRKGGARPRPK